MLTVFAFRTATIQPREFDPIMESDKREPAANKPRYQATARELPLLRKQVDRMNAETAPRIKVLKDRPEIWSIDHPNSTVGLSLLAEALGTANLDFVRVFLHQLVNAGSQGQTPDEAGINFMLAVIKGIKPNDQLEAMLAAQMAAIHMATMTFARRLAQVENIPQQDSAERALNKLARTFTTQMEALKRYRTGGEQKVTVQHVSVGEGGQAIVGNVTQAARESAQEKAADSTPALTDVRQSAMPIIEKTNPAPIAVQRRQDDDDDDDDDDEGRSST